MQLHLQPKNLIKASKLSTINSIFGSENGTFYKYGTDTIVAYSHIESIVDSVGLLENYTVKNGKYSGKSINKYNPAKKRWEQYWIDNSGLTLFLYGNLVDGKMVLTDSLEVDSLKRISRITWEKLEDESVRQTWFISLDKGKTWKTVFDGQYKRRKEN